jgi:hypothetical protein
MVMVAGSVAQMGEKINVYRIFMNKSTEHGKGRGNKIILKLT